MKTLKNLLDTGKVKIAKLPKNNSWIISNNKIDFSRLESLEGLLVYTIEHDYSGISAHMQNYTLNKLGIDSIRSLFLIVSKENSKELYDVLKKTPNYIGGGAGSGLKEIIIDYMDELEDSAKNLQSVNAIYKKGNKLIGFNTDGLGYRIGLENLLKQKSLSLKGKKITVLGAGGVALSIIYELTTLNPSKIIIVNRTISKAENIANYLNSILNKNLITSSGEDEMKKSISGSSLIVNVSNKGADGRFSEFLAFAKVYDDLSNNEIEARENLSKFLKNGIVSDIILSSKTQTKTLQLAKQLGFITQDGTNMVLYQAVPAFKKILSYSKYSDILEEDLLKFMRNSLK